MEYKIKPINQDITNGEELVFPDLKDRIIEKRGEVLEFTMSDIETNLAELKKLRREFEGKLKIEAAKVENIEHHHPYVKDLDDEKLFTIHMYKESRSWVDICNRKLKEIDEQMLKDQEEIAEIKAQIPELADIKSPFTNDNGEVLNEEGN